MAKTGAVKKIDFKRLTALIIAAAVFVGMAFSVKKFLAEKEKGEAQRLERQAEEKAKSEAEATEKLYGKLFSTVADTDDARRYGYDVLFARYGVRVLLKESKIYTDEPELTFEMVNESDEDFKIAIDYCVINGLTYHPDFEAEIPAGKTVTDKVVFNYEKMAEIKINKLRMCFKIINSDYSIYEASKAILINYDKSDATDSWLPPESAETVYESGTFSIYCNQLSIEDDRDGGKIVNSRFFYNNYYSSDIQIYLHDYTMFDKNGSEIHYGEHHAIFRDMIPGNAYASSYSPLMIMIDDTIDPGDLGEILIVADLYKRGDENEKVDTISFRVPLQFE